MRLNRVCVFFSLHAPGQIGAALDELFVCILKFEIILTETGY